MLLHKNDSPLEKKMSGKIIEWKSSKKKESLQDEGNETKFKGHHKLHARSHKKLGMLIMTTLIPLLTRAIL